MSVRNIHLQIDNSLFVKTPDNSKRTLLIAMMTRDKHRLYPGEDSGYGTNKKERISNDLKIHTTFPGSTSGRDRSKR